MALMQTGKGNSQNPANGIQENVRMLFDSGQRTCITEKLARKLNFKLGKKSKISLVSFGSEKSLPLDTPSTILNMQCRDANSIPAVYKTGNIYGKTMSLQILFFLELETSTIDLLIGDYYLDLILPKTVEIQPGLYMLGSKLDWILAGTSDSVRQ